MYALASISLRYAVMQWVRNHCDYAESQFHGANLMIKASCHTRCVLRAGIFKATGSTDPMFSWKSAESVSASGYAVPRSEHVIAGSEYR